MVTMQALISPQNPLKIRENEENLNSTFKKSIKEIKFYVNFFNHNLKKENCKNCKIISHAVAPFLFISKCRLRKSGEEKKKLIWEINWKIKSTLYLNMAEKYAHQSRDYRERISKWPQFIRSDIFKSDSRHNLKYLI